MSGELRHALASCGDGRIPVWEIRAFELSLFPPTRKRKSWDFSTTLNPLLLLSVYHKVLPSALKPWLCWERGGNVKWRILGGTKGGLEGVWGVLAGPGWAPACFDVRAFGCVAICIACE